MCQFNTAKLEKVIANDHLCAMLCFLNLFPFSLNLEFQYEAVQDQSQILVLRPLSHT